jgi:ribosome-associated protein
MPGMAVTPRKLLDLVTDALDDGKAEDIKSFDVSTLTSIADFMVVATGRSSRQVKALAERVADAARKRKVKPLGMEGEQTSEWVLVDLGDVIVHVMQPETRAFYQLEKLWDSVPAPRAKPAAKAAPEKPAKPATRGKPPAKAGRAVAGAPKPRAAPRKAAATAPVEAVVAKPVVRKPRKPASAAKAPVGVAKPVVRKPRKTASPATAPAKAAPPRRARAKTTPKA